MNYKLIFSISALSLGVMLGQSAPAVDIFVVDLPSTKDEIQDAVDAAAPGDVIHVGPGEFAGAEIFKMVTIIGSSGTIINERNRNPFRDAFSMLDGADGSMIHDMTFIGGDFVFGVAGEDVDDVAVTNSVFQDTFFAVWNFGGDRWQIADLDVHNCAFGMLATQANDWTVTNNVFLDTYHAVHIRGSSGWTITDNVIDGFIPLEGPVNENHQEAIIIQAGVVPASNNYIGNNWIRHEGERNPGFLVELNAGITLISSGGASLENNIVVGNEIEIAVSDADFSAGVGLISVVNPDAATNNVIVDNDLRRSLTPIVLEPKNLKKSNVVRPNLVR